MVVVASRTMDGPSLMGGSLGFPLRAGERAHYSTVSISVRIFAPPAEWSLMALNGDLLRLFVLVSPTNPSNYPARLLNSLQISCEHDCTFRHNRLDIYRRLKGDEEAYGVWRRRRPRSASHNLIITTSAINLGPAVTLSIQSEHSI